MIHILRVELNTSEFDKAMKEKVNKVKEVFNETSYERLEILNEHTEAKVPYRTGRLRASLMRGNTVVSDGAYLTQEFEYSALDPRDNYDYALVTHEGGYGSVEFDFKYPTATDHYLIKGLDEAYPYIMKELVNDIKGALR